MWRPSVNFVTLHYAYIIGCSILGLIILYPHGNLAAVDAYFFGASGSTESGLNTVDVKALATYQQLVIYFFPIVTNLGFINIFVVVFRLYWFDKRLKHIAPKYLAARQNRSHDNVEAQVVAQPQIEAKIDIASSQSRHPVTPHAHDGSRSPSAVQSSQNHAQQDTDPLGTSVLPPVGLTKAVSRSAVTSQLNEEEDDCAISKIDWPASSRPESSKPRSSSHGNATSVAHVTSSMWVLGATPTHHSGAGAETEDSQFRERRKSHLLSSQAKVKRNSNFANLTREDQEYLGGVEYRALKLLLKIITGYFFGLHIFGAICLAGWIRHADARYRDYIASQGQDIIWWAFYSAQTMVNNLGFTLTPDSMISFQDAIFPLLLMTFLAFAGNTFYPCVLRFIIWTMSKLVPKKSSLREPLQFLLDHPRRCYTLLFPSKPTWILFGILMVLNFVDILFILLLDLHNTEVNHLPVGPRIVSAIFQTASSRHTGTATFNLANVNPGVQISLMVMMYISVYPIAISIRASNTYEEKSLGMYSEQGELDERKSSWLYVQRHFYNQLSFDLWYVFLGIFLISIAEADRIADQNDPAFALFPIFFEVVSAYGNVGLSIGYPTVLTSLCGQFGTFSKLVICAMMIRGRHRGLPYTIDRAVMLPRESDYETENTHND